MNSKGLNITKEQIDKWQNSLSYKWYMWFSRTWVGEKYYNIKEGIPSLIKWFKIIWNDRDWDYHFIYDTLRFKIENTANHIEKHQRSTQWSDVKWMRTCVRLIDKLSDGYYEHEYQEEVERIWGKSEIKFTPVDKKLGDEELFEMKIVYEKANTPEDYEKIYAMVSEGIKRGQERHNKARRLLFEIITWKIEHWWD